MVCMFTPTTRVKPWCRAVLANVCFQYCLISLRCELYPLLQLQFWLWTPTRICRTQLQRCKVLRSPWQAERRLYTNNRDTTALFSQFAMRSRRLVFASSVQTCRRRWFQHTSSSSWETCFMTWRIFRSNDSQLAADFSRRQFVGAAMRL